MRLVWLNDRRVSTFFPPLLFELTAAFPSNTCHFVTPAYSRKRNLSNDELFLLSGTPVVPVYRIKNKPKKTRRRGRRKKTQKTDL